LSRLGGSRTQWAGAVLRNLADTEKTNRLRRPAKAEEPELPAARLLDDQSYFWVKDRPGRVSVCADRSALNWFGSNPRACTVVGAICRVSNWFKKVEASYFGFETNSRNVAGDLRRSYRSRSAKSMAGDSDIKGRSKEATSNLGRSYREACTIRTMPGRITPTLRLSRLRAATLVR